LRPEEIAIAYMFLKAKKIKFQVQLCLAISDFEAPITACLAYS